MTADVDVQFFSHLNGLVLGNNWGDLVRLLDKALVTGIDFTQITAASIDEQGDVHITLYSDHKAMLFQVVELFGFAPATLNQKYRIKGVPNTTKLILKPHTAIVESVISITGSGKLAPLGYDIVFRDTNDVKRVYRAKEPTAQHPFIRVDESLTSKDGISGVYTSSYARYAMVGLLSSMMHIDDFDNPAVLQLPFDPSEASKNYSIVGTGSSVKRGWSRWYYAKGDGGTADTSTSIAGNASFTLCGSCDAFYLLRAADPRVNSLKTLLGCGLYTSALPTSVIPNWFLMTRLLNTLAKDSTSSLIPDGDPLMRSENVSGFYTPRYSPQDILKTHTLTKGVLPDYNSGLSGLYSGAGLASLEIPIFDDVKFLKGTLKTITYAGNNLSSNTITTPLITNNSMYVWDSVDAYANGATTAGGFYFYLGEI